MTLEEVRRVARASSFQPFTLRTVAGQEHRIQDPKHIMAPPAGRRIVVAEPGEPIRILDAATVIAIEPAPDADGWIPGVL